MGSRGGRPAKKDLQKLLKKSKKEGQFLMGRDHEKCRKRNGGGRKKTTGKASFETGRGAGSTEGGKAGTGRKKRNLKSPVWERGWGKKTDTTTKGGGGGKRPKRLLKLQVREGNGAKQ